MVERRRGGDLALAFDDVDVGQRRQRVDQCVAWENGRRALLDQDLLGASADDELAVLVGIAATLGPDVQVDLLTRFTGRLAKVAGAASPSLSGRIDNRLHVGGRGVHGAAESRPCGKVDRHGLVDVDARGPDRIVEQHLAEKTLRLRGFVAVRLRRRTRRRGDVGIPGRHPQLVDATDLLADEIAQLSRAIAAVGADAGAPQCQRRGQECAKGARTQGLGPLEFGHDRRVPPQRLRACRWFRLSEDPDHESS